jgi:hypothetical protein
MKQGNQSIYFFMVRWEVTVREAGMNPAEHFPFLQLRLCQGIDPSVLQTMTASVDGIPNEYDKFWDACMRIHEERRWLHTLNETQKTANAWTPRTTNYNPPITPAPTNVDHDGDIVMGKNRPTQPLGKLDPKTREHLAKTGGCFRCRQPGHLAANCPLNLR